MFKCKCSKLILILLFLVIILNLLLYLRIISSKSKYVSSSEADNIIDMDTLEMLNSTLSKLEMEYHIIRSSKEFITSKNITRLETNHNLSKYHTKNDQSIHVNLTTKNQAVVKTVTSSVILPKNVLIFTMDSIASYEENSLSGGASGELTIRRSLEYALKRFGLHTQVIKSDQEFNRCNLQLYDIIILDPWTWATKGWVPKRNLIGQEKKIYILDYFGSKKMKGKGLPIAPTRILTAFGSPKNTFLGYFINTQNNEKTYYNKLQQGVVWGKDPKHLGDKVELLKAVADDVKLLSTATNVLFSYPNISWLGHQSSSKWIKLLEESSFLLGLGNPILGPSAIDSISKGCMYINPVYKKAVLVNDIPITTQHPFAAEKIGLPYVCNYEDNNIKELKKCINLALNSKLPSKIPIEFTLDAYLSRVKDIFSL